MNCAIIFGLPFLLLYVVSGETNPKSSMKHAISLETTTLIRTIQSTQLTKDLTTTMVTENRQLTESTTETQINTNLKIKDGHDASVHPPIVITTESLSIISPKLKDAREISVTTPIAITSSTDFYDFEKGTTSDDANSLYQTTPTSTTKDWNYNGAMKTSNNVTNSLTHLQENTTEWVGITSHLNKSLNGNEDSMIPNNSDYETASHYLQPEDMVKTKDTDTSLNITDIVATPTPYDSDSSNYITYRYATLQTSTTPADKNLYTSTNTLRSFVYTSDSNDGLKSLSAFEVTESYRHDGNIKDILEKEDGSRETENGRNLELENSAPNLSQEDNTYVPEALDSTMKSSENNQTLGEYQDDNAYPNNFTESSHESSKTEDTVGTENTFHFTPTEYSQARTRADEEKTQTESSAWESYTSSGDTDNETKANNDASDRVTEITKSTVREERKFVVNGEDPVHKPDISNTSNTILPDLNPFNATSVFSAGNHTLTSTTHNKNVKTTLPSIKEIYNSWSSELTTIVSGAFSTISTSSTRIPSELKPTLGNQNKSRVNPNVSSTDWIILLSSLKSVFNLSEETIASFTDPSINWFDVTKKQNFNNFTTAAPESVYETSTSYASTEIRKISKEELFYFYIIGGSLLVMLIAILTLMVVHFFRRNQRDSVDISEIPHLNIKIDDYRLAPIPRISTASNFKTGDPILSHHYLLENASDNMAQKMQAYKTSPFFIKPS